MKSIVSILFVISIQFSLNAKNFHSNCFSFECSYSSNLEMDNDINPVEVEKSALGFDITFPVENGVEARAYIIRAPRPTMKYLFVFHEWWGLNEQIKESAEAYYKDLKDVTVICIDLFDGQSTSNEEEAHKLMLSNESRMNDILRGAIDYVGPRVQVATLGWSFGGHWSLKASLALQDQAAGCVVYYGMPIESIEELKPLQADVLGIYGMQDGWVTSRKVKQFEENMNELKLSVEIVSYQLGHAFANPAEPQYNKRAAKSSYKISKQFLKSCYSLQ